MSAPDASPKSLHESTPRCLRDPRGRLRLYLNLTKARLSALVLVTAAVGYLLASEGVIDWLGFTVALIGTALAAAGTNALNQWMETARDARMFRTRNRPLPSGALNRNEALLVSIALIVVGVGGLAVFTNELAAFLTLLTTALYVAVYTPMKPISTLNTLVGAVSGAVPPMVGWAAATGSLGFGAWVLAGILFIWQLPHFLSLAWLYREDYERGGFRMLPLIDPGGELTGRMAVLTSLLLVPVTLMTAVAGIGGWIYLIGAILLGLLLIAASVGLYLDRSGASARRLFLASIIYLPLLMTLMVLDRDGDFQPRSDSANALLAELAEHPPAG